MKRLLLLLTLILSLHVSPLQAAEALPEYTLKAAYLYNFALLTDWPLESKSEDFNLCVYGHDSFSFALSTLENKAIGERIIKVRTITVPEDAKKCQIVFFGEADKNKEQKLLREIASLPILLVSDNAKIAHYHILIVQDNERLAFTINTKALKESNLNLSSRLLNLAKKVTP